MPGQADLLNARCPPCLLSDSDCLIPGTGRGGFSLDSGTLPIEKTGSNPSLIYSGQQQQGGPRMWRVPAAHPVAEAARAGCRCACQAGQGDEDLPLRLGGAFKQVCHALPLFLGSRLVLLALLGTMRLRKLQHILKAQLELTIGMERAAPTTRMQLVELLSFEDRTGGHMESPT